MGILIAHDNPGGVLHTRPRGLPLFALLAAAACVAAAGPLAAQTRNPIWLVSSEDAGKAASAMVAERASAKEGGFAVWTGAKLDEPVIYVDSSGDTAAYCFAVKGSGKPAGYVLVSARRFSEPIQEFSAGQPPHEKYLQAARSAAEAKLGEGRKTGKPSFVYAGPLALAARFPAAEPQTPGEEVLVAMRTQTVLAPEALRELERAAEDMAVTKAAWAAILSGKSPEGGQRPEFRYLANVPLGPSPCKGDTAALAALLSYWGIRAAGETDAALCEAAAAALKESGGDVPPAAASLGQARGTALALAKQASRDPGELFTACRIEIGAGRPLLARAGFAGAGSWAPCAGYIASAQGQFLALHDLQGGGADSKGDAWARPGVVYCNRNCDRGLETLTGAP